MEDISEFYIKRMEIQRIEKFRSSGLFAIRSLKLVTGKEWEGTQGPGDTGPRSTGHGATDHRSKG